LSVITRQDIPAAPARSELLDHPLAGMTTSRFPVIIRLRGMMTPRE
jgi:hypothetical protein